MKVENNYVNVEQNNYVKVENNYVNVEVNYVNRIIMGKLCNDRIYPSVFASL